jgi:UDP-N-acetylglucosamine acyltransferase
MKAHATAQVDPSAEVAPDVEIGPFSVVGPGVQLGPGCRLLARVVITGPAAIGSRNLFHPNAVIGGGPPRTGHIEIGDDNIFREAVTVNPPEGSGRTLIGSRNQFLASSNVGPGCRVGNDVVLGSFSAVQARTVVEDGARLEPGGGTREDIQVGRGALLHSHTVAVRDLPPYMCIAGDTPEVVGVNPRFRTPALERAFETLWKSGLPATEALERLGADLSPEVAELVAFLRRSAGRAADE